MSRNISIWWRIKSNKNNIEYIESIDKNEDETPRLIKLENYQGLVVTLVLDLGYFVESIIIRLGTVQNRNVKLCISKQRINHLSLNSLIRLFNKEGLHWKFTKMSNETIVIKVNSLEFIYTFEEEFFGLYIVQSAAPLTK